MDDDWGGGHGLAVVIVVVGPPGVRGSRNFAAFVVRPNNVNVAAETKWPWQRPDRKRANE